MQTLTSPSVYLESLKRKMSSENFTYVCLCCRYFEQTIHYWYTEYRYLSHCVNITILKEYFARIWKFVFNDRWERMKEAEWEREWKSDGSNGEIISKSEILDMSLPRIQCWEHRDDSRFKIIPKPSVTSDNCVYHRLRHFISFHTAFIAFFHVSSYLLWSHMYRALSISYSAHSSNAP